MAHTPKSERQHDKAAAASDRWTARSYAERDPSPRHPTHLRQAEAIDREAAKLAVANRDYQRHARRELAANGWDARGCRGAELVQAHAVAQLDHRWNDKMEQER